MGEKKAYKAMNHDANSPMFLKLVTRTQLRAGQNESGTKLMVLKLQYTYQNQQAIRGDHK